MSVRMLLNRRKIIIRTFPVNEKLTPMLACLFCILQVECHAWFPQYEMVDYCLQRGITFAAYAPIGSPGRPA